MQKKSILLLFLTILITNPILIAATPPIIEWTKSIGGSNSDFGSQIIKSSTGQIWLLGNTDSNNGDISTNHGSTDIWLAKYDISGRLICQFSFGGSGIDDATAIVECNGKFIIAGYTSSSNGDVTYNRGGFDAWVVCVDTLGTIQWQRTFGGSRSDLAYSICNSANGGFLVSGGSFSFDNDLPLNKGNEDAWVFKIDVAGNLVWSYSFGGTDLDVLYSIAEDSQGNIYCSGTTNSTDGDITTNYGNYDWLLLKLNSSGNLIFSRTFGGSSYDASTTMIINNNQNIIIGGYSRSNNHDLSMNIGGTDCWILEVDTLGAILRSKQFGGTQSENVFDIKQSTDGGYLLACGSTSNDFDVASNFGGEDIWILKTDGSFNIEWKKSYGGGNNDRPASIIELNTGQYLFVGYSYSNNFMVSNNHGNSDIWMAELNCRAPHAVIAPIGNSFCLGDTISLVSLATNNSDQVWNIQSTSSHDSIFQFIPATIGSNTIQLTAQTCTSISTTSVTLAVNDCYIPNVSFNLSNSQVCANSSVQFNDHSTNATSWSWTFPGGLPATSSDQNPIVTYSTAGTYSVLLTAINSHGTQTLMRVNCIVVHPNPSAPIITVNGNTLTSSYANSYQWNFNSVALPGNNLQIFTALNDGFYSVDVTNQFNCSSTSDSIYLTVDEVISLDHAIEGIYLFPNPAKDQVRVYNNGKRKINSITVYNSIGEKIIKEIGAQLLTTIDLTGVPPSYLILETIFDDGTRKSFPFIKQ